MNEVSKKSTAPSEESVPITLTGFERGFWQQNTATIFTSKATFLGIVENDAKNTQWRALRDPAG